ncbi:putative prohead protease [Klebsiella phage vB_KaS-Benoit]|uniref:Head maturation protease n=23 Tax=Viruses TaxID=10239 RepID=A0A2H4PH67_9CAUD|nr:major head protein [Klebsiella phage vB_Kpn_IME260]YP_009621079.1 major head protein [Klebsiella phage Sugarland]QBX06884.1 capsid & scaffold protein [Klebsiella phage Spivey]QCG76578.1 prohead protease [Klebsiella phage vB_KpnS_FZ41]QEA03180.1 putative prohead protease [Klebsiella phage KpGranit]QEG11193.1 capsid and scaffold protein [Klebsiella phage KPN4]QFR57421.1 capsid and scaffold protein [Klebsiella phage AmPh_EK80]QJT71617.1 prohead protease [Klebsiella phage vB_Kpn_B01]QVW27574
MQNINLNAEIKSVKAVGEGDNPPLKIKGYANTITKDRAGDVILSEAWTTSNALKNFMKNPIMLFGHNHSRPIGKILDLVPTESGLMVEGEVSAADLQIYSLIRDEVLKTFSVGFYIKDAEWDDMTETFIIKDLELLEISVVSVPCNQDSTFSLSKSVNHNDYMELRKSFVKSSQVQPVEQPELSNLEKFLVAAGYAKG